MDVVGKVGRDRRYLSERMVSASREMSSSNWTSFTPRFSMREVNTPWISLLVYYMEYYRSERWRKEGRTYLIRLDRAPTTSVRHCESDLE